MMPEKSRTITYEELMSIHRQESRQQLLVKVSKEFYRQVADYLDALNERCSKEGEADTEISGMLLSQLKKAQGKSAEIYELRMRKIALMAMTSAFGAEPKLEHATKEEIDAFETLKKFFVEHHERTLKRKCEEEKAEEIAEKEAESVHEEVLIQEDEAPEQKETLDDNKEEMIIVRILEDIPAFAGTDRNYQLMKEDVISLPKNIAEILVRHNKAVKIKHSI